MPADARVQPWKLLFPQAGPDAPAAHADGGDSTAPDPDGKPRQEWVIRKSKGGDQITG